MRRTRRHIHVLLLLGAVTVAGLGLLRAEEQDAEDSQPARMTAEEWHAGDPRPPRVTAEERDAGDSRPAPVMAEEWGAGDPPPAPAMAEADRSPLLSEVWTLHAFVVDRTDGWPLRGATVRAWLVRPGVRTLLDTGTTYAGGRAILDVSRLEHLPAVLRAISLVEVEADLDGWHIDQDTPYVLPGHPPSLRLPAWPRAGERQLRAVCQMSDRGSVTGRILDTRGRPVADAGVRITGQRPETTTCSDGRFCLPVDQDGSARVRIADSRFGYWSSDALQLEAPRDTDLGDITLDAKATHFGRIVDLSGRPVVNMPLVFGNLEVVHGTQAASWDQPFRPRYEIRRTTTSAAGEFSMPLHEWGSYHRIHECSPHAVSSPPLRIPFTRLTKAGTYGEPWVLEHHRVRGRVLLPGGTPLPATEVRVTIGAPHATTQSIRTDAEGRFEVLLGSGRTATLRARVAHTHAALAHVTAPPTPGTQDLRLVLQPTTGAHGIEVSARGVGDESVKQLTCIVWNEQYEEIARRRVVGASHMRLSLPAGRYWLSLSSEDRRAFGADGLLWQRYRPTYALVHVRRFRENRFRHRFEELAYVRIYPHMDEVDPRIKAHLLRVRAVRVAGEASTRAWESWWPRKGTWGQAQALAPGVYDLHVRVWGYRDQVQRITLVPGRLVDTHVRLVRTR